MKIEEIQTLGVGDRVYWNFFMAGLGKGFKNHVFTITNVEKIENPKIADPYWTTNKDFGPAKKLTLEDYETKKVFYLIVPLDWEKERYIYFTNPDDLPGDSLSPEAITLFRKSQDKK